MERTPRISPGTAVVVVVAVLALLNVAEIRVAHASLREAFRGTRYRLDWGHALLTALVLISVGTVLVEEVAFRGVIWGLLRRLRGTGTATVASSVLSGLWHVLPSLGLTTDNEAITGTVGRGTSAQAETVLVTVLFTTLSGVGSCELRRRSGSILASAGLHWATNALSVLASAAVWAWGTR